MAQTAVDIVVKTVGANKLDALANKLKKAETEVKRLESSIAKQGAANSLLKQKLGELTGTYSKISAAQQKFGDKNGKAAQRLRELKAEIDKTKTALRGGLELNLKNKAQLVKAKNDVKELGDAAKKAQGSLRGLGKNLAGLVTSYASVATAAALAGNAINTAIKREESIRRLQLLSEGYGEFNRLQQAATEAANKFGLGQTKTNQALADVYARLKPVGASLEDIVSVYNGFNTAARNSGASAIEASNAFRQLSQALGSGALRGDEFNSISEQVPGILTAISKETGIAQGKLREFAADGGITSDIVLRALKRLEKEGAEQLEKSLEGPEQKLKELENKTEDLNVAIGKLGLPAVLAVVDNIGGKVDEWATAVNNLTTAFSGLDERLGPILDKLIQINNIIANLNPLGFLTDGLPKSVNSLFGNLNKDAQATPAAESVAPVATEAEKFFGVANQTTEALKGQTAELDSIKTKLEANTQTASDYLSGLKLQTQEIQQQGQQIANRASIEQARIGAAQSLNDLERQRLETYYEQATSQQAAKNLAIELFNNAVRGANLEKEAKLAALEVDIQKTKIQQQIQESKYLEIQAEGQLQKLKAQSIEKEAKRAQKIAAIEGATKSALDIQSLVVKAAAEQVGVQKQIAEYQSQSAEYQRQGKIEAAAVGLKQKLISEKVSLSNQAAGQLTNNLKNSAIQSGAAATSSNKLATGLNSSAESANKTATMMIRVATEADKAAVAIQRAAAAQAQLNAAKGGGGSPQPTGAANGAFWEGGFRAFASGGYVDAPTLGIVGEGGGNEYVIPENRMDDAMRRWNGGSRGDAVVNGSNPGGSGSGTSSITPEINVTTGPVMRMDNSNYINQKDFVAGLQQASQQGAEMALVAIQSNGGLRRQLGVS